MMAIPLFNPILRRPIVLPLAVAGVSAISLLVALVAQYGFGLEPCVLCAYQRMPFAIALCLAAAALAKPEWLTPLMICAGLVFLCNAALAFYHVGVEQHWWSISTGCAGEISSTDFNPEQFLSNLRKTRPKACDEVNWTFLGISMATHNAVYCLALGLATLSASGALRGRLKDKA